MTDKKRFTAEIHTSNIDGLCECFGCKNYPEIVHMTFASTSSATAKRFVCEMFPEAKIYVREL